MDYTVFISSTLAFVLYLNSLDADFAYDDSRAIQKNQDLLPETPLINILYDDFWGTPLKHSGSHKSYRPLCVLSFRLNYYLGEFNPWGYHLGNILLHVLVTGIFTKLARTFLQHTFSTLLAGLLFASHPVHTEAVAGIVGRADVGACLFFLLAFQSYIQYVKYRDSYTNHVTDSAPYWGLLCILSTGVFTAASMLTKELGVTVIAVCAVYDLFVHNKEQVIDVVSFQWMKNKKLRKGIFSLIAIGVLLVAFRIMFMGNKPPEFAPSDNPASDSDSISTRFLTYMLLPVFNAWILLCPRVLSFDWSMDTIPLVESIVDIRNIYSIIFYSTLCYIGIHLLKYLHKSNVSITHSVKPHMNGNGVSHLNQNHKHNVNGRKHKHSRRGSNSSTGSEDSDHVDSKSHFTSQDIFIISLSLMVFPFIPATNLFFYVGFVIAERVLYIPSMGFCLLVSHGAYCLYKKYSSNEMKKKCVIVSLGILLLMFSARTFLRNRVWQSEENLYSSGLSTNPAKAWGNLANVWNQQGKKYEAEQAYRNALKHRGNMADTHYNLGILLQDQKRMDEAVESYKRAIQCRPKLSMAHLNLAIIYAGQGHYTEAEKIYRHCANLDTSGLKDPRLHENTKISALYNLGRMLSEQDRNKEAVEVYKEALRRRPSYYAPQSIYNMMGEVYMKLGQTDEAEKWYREALKVKADHIPAHLTMAKLFHTKNQIQTAEEWFQKAKKIDPEDASIDHHYAQFLADTGRMKESAIMYRRAVQKSPEDFETVFNAANVLRQIGDNDISQKLYEKAVELRPHIATAHMNLGAMYHLNGHLDKAELSYLEALKLKPNDVTTQQNLIKLRNLRQSKEIERNGNGKQRANGSR